MFYFISTNYTVGDYCLKGLAVAFGGFLQMMSSIFKPTNPHLAFVVRA
jgi:hypothetical protein